MKRARRGAQAPLLRQLNEREILAALQNHGPLSRAEVARITGISGPTVTRTVAALLEARLLEEGEFHVASFGRPGKTLRLAHTNALVLGVVVEPRRCELVSAGLDGRIHQEEPMRFATPARYRDLVESIVRHVNDLVAEGDKPLLGVGISIPGLLNRHDQRTVTSPNLHQTDGQRLGADVQERLSVETTILQESHALCLAEQTYGAARGVADFAMLDITGGLGLGVVNGGRVVEGHSGLAGELGHVTAVLDGERCGCGNRGCLETVATDAALASAISARLGKELTIEEIVPQLQRGELRADREIERLLQYVAVAVAAVINIFNPARLFLFGRCLDIGPQVFERMLELTRERALTPSLTDCEIIRAQGNKCLGAIAGIVHRLTTGREQGAG